MTNATIARFFFRLANLLEIAGEKDFKLRAYRRVAEHLLDRDEQVHAMVESGQDLQSIPGVGAAIAEKLRHLVVHGSFPLYDQVRSSTPEGLLELLFVRGLGPSKVRTLHRDLGITSVETLTQALEDGRLRDARGFSARTEDRIRRSLYEYLAHRNRTLRAAAERPADSLCEFLGTLPEVKAVAPAGAFRRGEETVPEIPLVVATTAPEQVLDRVSQWPYFATWLARTVPTASLQTDDEQTITITTTPPQRFGVKLFRLTGPDDFVDAFEPLPESAPDEAALFAARALPAVPPEIRRLEWLEEVKTQGAPELVTLADIQGDLHMHTTSSDGRQSATEMARACHARGYSYLAITDHTRNVKIAGGLHPEDIPAYFEAIEQAQSEVPEIRVLKGLEVDILADGTMDMPDEIMAQLDVVIGAIHSHFDQDAETMTRRVLRALEHPLVQFIAHPSGRLVGSRSPFLLDFDRLFDAAERTGTMLELNANPERLDLHAEHCRIARERNIPIVINTDAHAVWQLANMDRGILQGRRGLIAPKDVLNTLPVNELVQRLTWKRRQG